MTLFETHLHACPHFDKVSCCACRCRAHSLLKDAKPSFLSLQRDKTSGLPPYSIGIEFVPCTPSKGASKHLARGSKWNVFYLFLTLSPRRALHKVTSDMLLLAGTFFPLSLIFADEENGNCNPNIHCPHSETSGQISHEDQMQDGLTQT